MEKITVKDKLKQEKIEKKKAELEEITEAITNAVNNQIDFLSSDETSKTEKIKEYTRLAVWFPVTIIPKILNTYLYYIKNIFLICWFNAR